ncbi:hypothetical protein [Aeromonas schubertii]|uniref:hypothetical protein n=1 Tax=Aeromonas schubertii TaxID=652 RepID=UPI0010A93510|nr:hypothetical protein [Aeromonas schubertii]QCG49462.1 hypothetical protein E2P79_17960 [Aeromonas schubertii]
MQRMTYGVTGTLLQQELSLGRALGLGFVDDQAIADLSAFKRAGHFTYDPEVILPSYMTAGTGLPVRLIAYYDRTPVAYASGVLGDNSIDLHYWEVSTVAPKEVHVVWVPIVLAAMEGLSTGVEHFSQSETLVERFAFTSPERCDIIPFESAGFTYVDNYLKGIPAVVAYRTKAALDS